LNVGEVCRCRISALSVLQIVIILSRALRDSSLG